MSWALLGGLVLGLASLVVFVLWRRFELARMAEAVAERGRAKERGSHAARLQVPHVDLTRCLGCGTCIEACPEEGVLDVIHGQALVVHGARCVGHGACARECPVGAISVRIGDVETRRDLPALTDHFEVPGRPGLFLAGEVTGYSLIRTAISHGTAIATEVASRPGTTEDGTTGDDGVLDLCIVGAGPAGLACALEAKRRGLRTVTLEQETLGGTVGKYPRGKLVMTQPIELPLHGPLERTTYSKEELIDLWTRVIEEQELPIRTGVEVLGVDGDGGNGAPFQVRTRDGEVRARAVCLALGRRGTPRKLGVPGEERAKVAYGLLDARSHRGRRVLVVGGGDSAIEAALGLAAQPGNEVTLSYRKHAFFRLKPRNEAGILEAAEGGTVRVLYESQVEEIRDDAVTLRLGDQRLELENDEVFVFAGGEPPFKMLERSGVSFDPADRPRTREVREDSGLLTGLLAALVVAAGAWAWTRAFGDYYGRELVARRLADEHDLLRPGGGFGLAFGITATVMIATNLSYLLRRAPRVPFRWGSLRGWMTSHLATGVLALVFALLHGAMAPKNTVGGHALAALGGLVLTGAIGRYFYSFVPRAANGRELALEEVQARLAALSADWDQGNRDFGERVRRRVHELVAQGHWTGSVFTRARALLRTQSAFRRSLASLRQEAEAEGISPEEIDAVLGLARRAQRTALMAAHYEDLRALLGSWRYLHRWAALLMVLLVIVHVVVALRYGRLG